MVAASPGELSIADQEELLSNWHNQKRTWALGDELILKIRRLAELSFKHSGSATVYDRLTSVVNTLEADLESDGKRLPRTFPGLLSDADDDSTYLSKLFQVLLDLIQEQRGSYTETRPDVGTIRLYDIVCLCSALDETFQPTSDSADRMFTILKEAETIHKALLDSTKEPKSIERNGAEGSMLTADGVSVDHRAETWVPMIAAPSATELTIDGDTLTVERTTDYDATTATTHQPSVLTLKGVASRRPGQQSGNCDAQGRDSGYGSGKFSPKTIQSTDWVARDDTTASQMIGNSPAYESPGLQDVIHPLKLSPSFDRPSVTSEPRRLGSEPTIEDDRSYFRSILSRDHGWTSTPTTAASRASSATSRHNFKLKFRIPRTRPPQ